MERLTVFHASLSFLDASTLQLPLDRRLHRRGHLHYGDGLAAARSGVSLSQPDIARHRATTVATGTNQKNICMTYSLSGCTRLTNAGSSDHPIKWITIPAMQHPASVVIMPSLKRNNAIIAATDSTSDHGSRLDSAGICSVMPKACLTVTCANSV